VEPIEKDDARAAAYAIAGVSVRVFSPENMSNGLYAVDPPEYRLNPLSVQALAEALAEVTSMVPKDVEVKSLSTARPYIKQKVKDLIYARLSGRSDLSSGNLETETESLAEILCKYTAGYGLLETLLEDPKVQDIYIDSPSGQTPVQVVLRSDVRDRVRQKCRTNIFVGKKDLQGFVSRMKFETGLPFSEAHPVLEADMKRLGARITLVGPPMSEKGVSVAIRKRTASIWTVPMLISNGSLSPLLASFLWACVIGRRTVLIAGSRGAGKTTLLGAMMLEFPLSQRIILIEDTPEISVARMQALGYDLQALRFSAGEGSATSAEEALRVSLRMGESAIVIGEVRGREARVLYESMRAGSAGSSVLGTIHGNSACGVLDRAVEDLGVTERAFSSTDIVVVIGLFRAPDGTRFYRRVTEVAEVRPVGTRVELVSLFSTEPGCPCAKPSSEFGPESRAVTGIATALGTRPDLMMDVIKAKAYSDQVMTDASSGTVAPGFMGDEFRLRSNELLTQRLFDSQGTETGLKEWRRWFDEEASGGSTKA
jgi:type IV secretory pathway ATPase VirB11/archaellum biosynthesis ATPase